MGNRIAKTIRAILPSLKGEWRRFVLRFLGKDIARIRGTGIRIRTDPQTPFGQELLKHGQRPTEKFMIPLLKKILQPGDVFLDIGAHWGTYSIAASELVGPAGRVIAIEPFPASFRMLQANARLNRSRNLTAFNVAVGDRERPGYLVSIASGDNLAKFQEARPLSRWHGLPKALKRTMGIPIVTGCLMTTLAHILAKSGISEVAAMKMDIEGSECLAFQGLLPLAANIRFMLVELHPPFAGFSCDLSLLYRVLAINRGLFIVDCRSGQLSPVRSEMEFQERLGEYYFFSARNDALAGLTFEAEQE
jgi:FkbM family methyltransferase